MIITDPTYLKSVVSFLRTFRAKHVILSFGRYLEIYAEDVESINFLKAKIKIKKDTDPRRSIKVRLEDLKEVCSSIDKEVTELKMDLNMDLQMLEVSITFPMRTIHISILFQEGLTQPIWEKINFPLSWSMTQRAFKKSFSNQGQIERYIRVVGAEGQIQLETNKAHHVVCKETLFNDSVESAEFLISLDLIKRNLNLPCKKLTIGISRDVLQLASSTLTIRTFLIKNHTDSIP